MQSEALHTETDARRHELVRDVCCFIRENPTKKNSLADLGKRFGVSPYYLQRTFVGVMGISPRRYAEQCKVALFKLRLTRGEPVVTALRGAGYSSHSWAYKDSRVKLGMTPAAYKAGGDGTLVMYAIGDSTIGRLLVAATDHGICCVDVGDTDEELIGALTHEFPKARLVKSKRVVGLLTGVKDCLRGQEVNLPLDVRGTDFQIKVWKAIQQIPLGTTRNYSEIATMIGEPRAVRAVANACGSNPVPLIIPCHRVIRKDGSLGGYGLGLPRKRKLLAAEKTMARTDRLAGGKRNPTPKTQLSASELTLEPRVPT